MSKYSLWLMPVRDSELYKKLQGLINDLSQRFQAPAFKPHVTLIGNVLGTEEEILSQTEQLAKQIKPYEMTLDFLDFTDNLYQTLVIRTVATKEVVEANKRARDEFKNHSGTLYIPHISLLYKTGMDNEVKKGLIKEIGDKFKGEKFLAESIFISEQVKGGRIEDWKMAGEVSLNGR